MAIRWWLGRAHHEPGSQRHGTSSWAGRPSQDRKKNCRRHPRARRNAARRPVQVQVMGSHAPSTHLPRIQITGGLGLEASPPLRQRSAPQTRRARRHRRPRQPARSKQRQRDSHEQRALQQPEQEHQGGRCRWGGRDTSSLGSVVVGAVRTLVPPVTADDTYYTWCVRRRHVPGTNYSLPASIQCRHPTLTGPGFNARPPPAAPPRPAYKRRPPHLPAPPPLSSHLARAAKQIKVERRATTGLGHPFGRA